MTDLGAGDFPAALAAVVLSGLYTSFWGGFKDSPWEGFKPKTFPRSILFSLGIFAGLLLVPPLAERMAALSLPQLFFLVMGLERFLTELYKGFFRRESQAKYFVPSRITILGRPLESELLRRTVGVVLVALVLLVLLLPSPVTTFPGYLLVAYLTGLLVAGGGAYKDAPFEGFRYLKFQRSGVVLALLSPVFWWIRDPAVPLSLGFLIYLNGGLERFAVEYYKTFVQRNMSGKFRPDLPKLETKRREAFHYGALALIALVAVFCLAEATTGSAG